jgi:uncharacterized protein
LAALLAIVGVSTAQAQEAYAALSSDGKTLTFYYDTQRATHGTTYSIPWGGDYPGWTSSSGNAVIEHNGDLYACDHYVYPRYRLGNVLQTPIRALMAQDRVAEFAYRKWTSLPHHLS